MRDEADGAGTEGDTQHAPFARLRDELRGVRRSAPQMEDEDVRLDRREIQIDVRTLRQLFGEQAGVGVVLGSRSS